MMRVCVNINIRQPYILLNMCDNIPNIQTVCNPDLDELSRRVASNDMGVSAVGHNLVNHEQEAMFRKIDLGGQTRTAVGIPLDTVQKTKYINFWKEVLTLEYKPNTQKVPLHENQVEDLIQKYGYRYQKQPNGPQKHPDFYVYFDGNTEICIECKSIAKNKTMPVYNCTAPKIGTIYIFCCEKYNKTTIYWGDDMIAQEKREIYSRLEQALKQVVSNFRALPGWIDDERGFDFTVRNMYTQKGGSTLTDYFNHRNREKCEQNVINYFG